MDTITVKNAEGLDVTYTTSEVLSFVRLADLYHKGRDNHDKFKNQVRDFFSESEWSSSEATINRADVNELLVSIGSHPLEAKYSAVVTITASISGYTAENEDAVRDWLGDNLTVELYGGDIYVDDISVDDVEEEE
jgi:hypothetical protein